jgi:HPt (histidine-containing phosphotransfer) domain-containing protein
MDVQPQRRPEDDEPIVIRPDSVAGRLLPAFLERRTKDLTLIADALSQGEFRSIERMGHNLKGTGRSYECPGVSDIGAALEQAARERDAAEVRRQADALARYLRRVRIAR